MSLSDDSSQGSQNWAHNFVFYLDKRAASQTLKPVRDQNRQCIIHMSLPMWQHVTTNKLIHHTAVWTVFYEALTSTTVCGCVVGAMRLSWKMDKMQHDQSECGLYKYPICINIEATQIGCAYFLNGCMNHSVSWTFWSSFSSSFFPLPLKMMRSLSLWKRRRG